MLINIANQSNLDAARVGFHAAFLENLGIVDAMPLEQLMLQVPSTTSLEEWEWLSDMPGFEEWTNDRILDQMKSFKLRVVNKDWSSGLKLHQNQLKDDKLGLFPSQIKMLASAAKQHRATLAAQLLINGFDGVQFPAAGNGLAYDGKFFFDTTRVTGSNRHAMALDTTAAGLINAELLMGSQTSYDGKRKLRLKGTHIIVGPKLRSIADKLMGSDFLANTSASGQGGPGQAATESNYFKGRYQVIEEPWLVGAYANYWFLADLSQVAKPLLFQMREEISTSAILGGQGTDSDSTPRFKRGEYWFGAEARYNEAYLEPRLMVGAIL